MKKIAFTLIALLGTLAAAAQSGRLTSTITWEIADTILYITGTGDMPNCATSPAPWADREQAWNVKAIIVGEGITSIGEYSFSNPYADNGEQFTLNGGSARSDSKVKRYFGYFNNVRRVLLPSTLREIDANAFQNLLITAIAIPESVTRIGALAFNLCDLRYVKLPAGLRHLGYGAFEGCSNLRCVDFSGAAIKVPKGAFFDCERLEQVLNSDNIKEVNPLGVDATPMQSMTNIMAFMRLPNMLRYRVQNITPWGEYIDRFMPNPPALTAHETKALKSEIGKWKRSHRNHSQLELRELTDSLWLEAAETSDIDNSEWIENHRIVSTRYDEDLKQLVENYYNNLTRGKTLEFVSDEFALQPYDEASSCFIINTVHHGSLRMMVPPDRAELVSSRWSTMSRTAKPRFVRRDDNVALRNAVFTDSDGKAYAAAPV